MAGRTSGQKTTTWSELDEQEFARLQAKYEAEGDLSEDEHLRANDMFRRKSENWYQTDPVYREATDKFNQGVDLVERMGKFLRQEEKIRLITPLFLEALVTMQAARSKETKENADAAKETAPAS